MANLENLLDNGPTVSELSDLIAFQREEIQRLENVLKFYDWIETADQLPTAQDGDVFAYDASNLFYCTDWKIIANHAGQHPQWCRIRPMEVST